MKKTVPTRSQRTDDKADIFAESDNNDEEDEISDEKQKINDQKKEELLKKLCFLCENPKCSYFCKGYCKRSFHDCCRIKVEEEGINNIDEIVGKIDANELCLDEENLK